MKKTLPYLLLFVLCLGSVMAINIDSDVAFVPSDANSTYNASTIMTSIEQIVITNETFSIKAASEVAIILEAYNHGTNHIFFYYNTATKSLTITYAGTQSIDISGLTALMGDDTGNYDIQFAGADIATLQSSSTYTMSSPGTYVFLSSDRGAASGVMNSMVDNLVIVVTFLGLIIIMISLGIVLSLYTKGDMSLEELRTAIIIIVMTGILIGIGIIIFAALGNVT